MKGKNMNQNATEGMEVTPAMRAQLEAYWSEMTDWERDCLVASAKQDHLGDPVGLDDEMKRVRGAIADEFQELADAARAACADLGGEIETPEMRAALECIWAEQSAFEADCRRAMAGCR